MTVLPFLVVAAAAGTASLLARHRRGWSTAIAVFGLIVMIATSGAMGSAAAIEIGGMRLVASDWLRLFALLGSVVGLLLVLVDVTALHEPDAPGVIVLGTGASVLALSLSDPGVAVVAATAGGLAGVLVAAPIGAAARAAFVGTRELRALAVAGTLSILATAWLARPLGDLVSVPAVFGAAYLAFAAAVAIRFGAIPFHLWAARVADAAPGVALPLLMAWGPAAFAAVALVWIDQSVAPLVLPFDVERGLIAAVGAVSVLLGLARRVDPGRPRARRRLLDRRRRGLRRPRPRRPRPGDLGAGPDVAPDLRRRPERVRGVGRRAPRRLRDAPAAASSAAGLAGRRSSRSASSGSRSRRSAGRG